MTLICHVRASALALLIGPGAAVAADVPFSEHPIHASFNGAAAVCTGDIDDDGDLDVIGGASIADDVVWWRNNSGDGTSWTEVSIDPSFDGARAVAVADVNDDGDLDVVAAAANVSDVSWWENTTGTGLSWVEHPVNTSFLGARSVFAADIDGDDDIDIVGAAESGNRITWWQNTNGSGLSWIARPVDASFTGASAVVAADIDGDNDLDLVGAAFLADDIAWWENTAGTGLAWTKRIVAPSFDGARSVVAADIDGDTDLDLVGAAQNADDVRWWRNNGSGLTWTEGIIDLNFDGAASVRAADVDGDGDLDVVGAATLADDVAWWENSSGNGTTWIKRTVDGSFDAATAVAVGDIDGDRNTDLLAAAENADDISWWENGSPSCGDVNDDDTVDPLDVDAFREALADPAGAPLSPAGVSKCTVIDPPSGCDLLDLVVLRRTVEGPELLPGIAQVCDAVSP